MMKKLFLPILPAGISFFSSCFMFDRSGKKIYSYFFGQGPANCVQIFESTDVRAIDDDRVWIHFKACPNETKRILSQLPYKCTRLRLNKETVHDEKYPFASPPPEWWTIEKLGDSCLKFEYWYTDDDYVRFAYVSPDSTEIYYNDVRW